MLSTLPDYARACAKSREIASSSRSFVTQLELELPRKLHPLAKTALDATVIFAQEEAGSGVCISGDGLILTCAHCLDDETVGAERIVLFPNGEKCLAVCVAKDEQRDCALMRITQVGRRAIVPGGSAFPSLPVSDKPAPPRANVFCIGQPAGVDLECEEDGRATNYPIFYTSRGKVLGYMSEGADLHNNLDIGQMIHDCWTYWGHSGAPIVNELGRVVGLHSSWDEHTANRHGVPQQAIEAFLREAMQS